MLVYCAMCICLYRRAAFWRVLRIVVEGLRGVYGKELGQPLVNEAAMVGDNYLGRSTTTILAG